MLDKLRLLNPNMHIFDTNSPEFREYGVKIGDIDTDEIIKVGESFKMPESGTVYEPSTPKFEELKIATEITDKYFGQLPAQIGYCYGYNDTLNALEWHTASEINIAITDMVLILAKRSDLEDNKMASTVTKSFLVRKGEIVEIFATSLHYCPCQVSDDGFRSVVGLPLGTNTELDKTPDNKLLFAKNKWLIAHNDNAELIAKGAVAGISGENFKLKYQVINLKYLLGIDFGGGASKATLIDTFGNIIAESTTEYPTLYPEAGACEQSPADWIKALCNNTVSIIKNAGIEASDILCVAIDSATHTSLLCDKDFKPLGNAMHWTDTRSRTEADALREKMGEEIFKKTYHKPDTIWTLPQLIYLKNKNPELWQSVRYIFFEKDYIRYFLTNAYCTDYIEAEGSMLFNYNTMQWDDELLELAGLNKDMLPPIVKPTDIVGKVTDSAAAATGLKAGTPVICGTTDTVMEVFASGAVKSGNITVKLATAGRICVITDKPYPDRHIINYSHITNGLWYPGTATKSCAASYRWYRDTFGGDYKELDDAAAKLPIGADGLRFHPYLNGELTPYADPTLCGSFIGIRATHTKAHFTRSVLEGVAMSLLDSKLYLDSLNIPYDSVATAIGGGTKGKLWRQITADVLGITLKTTVSSDSSLGSAMLAGVAMGIFKDNEDAVQKCVKHKDITYPNFENTKKYAEIFKEYKKLHDALAPVYNAR